MTREPRETLPPQKRIASGLFVAAPVFALLVMTACSTTPGASTATPGTPEGTATVDVWAHLIEQIPYPYSTPLPPPQVTDVDGSYSKFDPREGTRPFCVRCMPYPAEGGTWLLNLDKGVYRIHSTRSLNGWRSLGSFTVSGNQIVLFNDPHCIKATGVYTWKLEAGELALTVVEDGCADGWRAITFTNQPWTLETPSDDG